MAASSAGTAASATGEHHGEIPGPGRATAPAFELKGVDSQLERWHTMVVIRRKGDLAKLPKGSFAGEKSLYYCNIARFESGGPGAMMNGYIQFGPTGGLKLRSGLIKETKDENAVFSERRDNEPVQRIESLRSSANRGELMSVTRRRLRISAYSRSPRLTIEGMASNRFFVCF